MLSALRRWQIYKGIKRKHYMGVLRNAEDTMQRSDVNSHEYTVAYKYYKRAYQNLYGMNGVAK